jgi:hypothetical protein
MSRNQSFDEVVKKMAKKEIPAYKDPQFDNLRKHRKENFKVQTKVKKDRLFVDEIVMEISPNGRQWYGTSLNEEEARKVVGVLSIHFGFGPVEFDKMICSYENPDCPFGKSK